jgi:DNA mismatch repair protein MSH6
VSSPPAIDVTETNDEDFDIDGDSTSTAAQWKFDPNDPNPTAHTRIPNKGAKSSAFPKKQKAHTTEPEKRHIWLAKIQDAERRTPDDPDFDVRNIFIPQHSLEKLSPFEQQYWNIKKNLWDTIVFFKKGKFYELYENDATIGHQLFDLKLTDRVNMRMVGVPESSLELWANQFVAKGYKVARVDQMESALGKEMRERDDPNATKKKPMKGDKKEAKIINRELASILTRGTLVDAAMLQDDMATYCVAIKEQDNEGTPSFGIAFVDTATAQFHVVEFNDDVDMTKFETFVAQVRPQELLLEKGHISAKALRILKNNTGPTTIWNYLRPDKEFWAPDITCREIDATGYFESKDDAKTGVWPEVLEQNKDKELLISALGALIQYLQTLKIDKELLSLGNFAWYDPIRKATSLVLDGQSLINLEIFANGFDGTDEGTLFGMLNRCITPFGKRMLRQWVCHPLADTAKINARLDAVDGLMADTSITEQFTASLAKLPDLERLISRIHANRCKAQDFVRVLQGFEQIEYTMGLLSSAPTGEGVIGQLLASMPDLAPKLEFWKTAFDRSKAQIDGVFVPESGVDDVYDESQRNIEACHKDLQNLLEDARQKLKTKSVVFRDIGKEVYQFEVPVKVSGIPKNWDQVSATQAVRRWYSPELRGTVRRLQELEETHGQVEKQVATRFFAQFDEDYNMWLKAVHIVAHLDCLISLATASSNMGSPSCRPELVDDENSVLEFEELRHPCMVSTVSDFIPNDIKLGGESANISLLTGANAAGKSTVLRMVSKYGCIFELSLTALQTCVAAILAQVGCHVPARNARLTPIDRIMSRLGAQDNIFAAQSTFFVELSETKKILTEATPRSLVILDELGRGTSSYDGVAVAQAVLHDVATRIGCIGFFATHYHSLAVEFQDHPEIQCTRMAIHVDDENRKVTFLYKLEEGIADGSFGMHCASMCGIPAKVVNRAEDAAKQWEHTSRLRESLEKAKGMSYVPLGMLSDVAWMMKDGPEKVSGRELDVLRKAIAAL